MLHQCRTNRKERDRSSRRQRGSGDCRRSRSSASARSSITWVRRWPCCCSPGSMGATEFLGTVLLAAAGARTARNAGALALTTAGVATVAVIRIAGQPLGFIFAFANCGLFMLYIVLGHRIANAGAGQGGIDRLAAAMLIAAVTATPWGLGGALPAFPHPVLLLAGPRWRVLLGDPLRDRPAGHGAATPGHVLAHAGAAAGVRHHHRCRRAAPAPPSRTSRHHPGSTRCRDSSGKQREGMTWTT